MKEDETVHGYWGEVIAAIDNVSNAWFSNQ
jgi:hypothetical protein